MDLICCTLMTFLVYPKITFKSKACLASYAAVSVGSVAVSPLVHYGSTATIKSFFQLIVRPTCFIISARFHYMNIVSIVKYLSPLKVPVGLCTVFIVIPSELCNV